MCAFCTYQNAEYPSIEKLSEAEKFELLISCIFKYLFLLACYYSLLLAFVRFFVVLVALVCKRYVFRCLSHLFVCYLLSHFCKSLLNILPISFVVFHFVCLFLHVFAARQGQQAAYDASAHKISLCRWMQAILIAHLWNENNNSNNNR